MKVSIVISLVLISSAAATPAASQTGVPGPGITSNRRHMTDFLNEVNQRVTGLTRQWRGAWVRDEIDDLVDLYTEDAVLILAEGEPIRGHRRLKQYFEESLATLGGAQLSETDFHASGRMALMSGPFSYLIQGENGLSWQVTGTHVTVFLREGRDWKIRSQIFRAN
jgi:ketosteroid isomerase-like protein